ncbi:MAG: hypothetical protein OHK0022_30980 [Roseiflexaceae bacterium]
MCDTPKQLQPTHNTLDRLRIALSHCDEFATPQRFEQLLKAVAPEWQPVLTHATSPKQRAAQVTHTLHTSWQGDQNLLEALLRRLVAAYPGPSELGRALRLLLQWLTAELEESGEAARRRGEHYLDLLERRPAAELLVAYLAEQRAIGYYEQIEWRLAELALEAPLADLHLEGIRPDLAQRPSGAMLLWVLGQRLRRAGTPAACLLDGTRLAARQAGIFVRAWALWPHNPCFREETACERLVDWLAVCGHPVLPVAPLLIAAGHPALAAGCVRRDMCPTTIEAALETAQALLGEPLCRDEGRQLLLSLIAAAKEPEQLRLLAQAAFVHDCYPETITAVTRLKQHGALDQQVIAWRIAAWAALGRHKRAAELYVSTWLADQAAPPFPHPRLLLPALRAPEAAGLRQQLLRNAGLDELNERQQLEALVARGQAEHTLKAWEQLLREQIQIDGVNWPATLADNSDTLDLLIQLTEACLQSRPDRRERWYAIMVWQGLRDHDQLAALSAAARTLLEPDPKRCTRIYEHWMPLEPALDDAWVHWVRRATLRYLEALAQQSRWEDARRFWEERHTQQLLRQAAPGEQRYWRLLHDLEQALAQNLPAHEHCRLWEQALCLALPDQYVCLLVEHFTNRRMRHGPGEQHRLDDLALHIERRGKALGERLVVERADLCKHHVRTHLAASDLGALGLLLNRLMHYPEECHDCHSNGHPDTQRDDDHSGSHNQNHHQLEQAGIG